MCVQVCNSAKMQHFLEKLLTENMHLNKDTRLKRSLVKQVKSLQQDELDHTQENEGNY